MSTRDSVCCGLRVSTRDSVGCGFKVLVSFYCGEGVQRGTNTNCIYLLEKTIEKSENIIMHWVKASPGFFLPRAVGPSEVK